MTTFTASYDPEDNKLRLRASARLDADLYKRVRDNGFIWAPKQDLFVAPTWTPSREDLLIELAGEIGDEDTSLTERAEQRAERFEGHSEARTADAEAASKASHAAIEHIPMGQPILVGHHSERKHRNALDRSWNKLGEAVKNWKTAEYWEQRAADAIRHAKYKQLPAVRARRIKGIEADLRKRQRSTKDCQDTIKLWKAVPDDRQDQALRIANTMPVHLSFKFPLDTYPREPRAERRTGDPYKTEMYEGDRSIFSALQDEIINVARARDLIVPPCERQIVRDARWITHYENRLAYERAMMGETGGLPTDQVKPEKGGAIRCLWAPDFGKGWAYITKVNKISVSIRHKSDHGDRVFSHTVPFDKVREVLSAAQVQELRDTGQLIEAFAGLDVGFYRRDQAQEEIK